MILCVCGRVSVLAMHVQVCLCTYVVCGKIGKKLAEVKLVQYIISRETFKSNGYFAGCCRRLKRFEHAAS